MENIIVHKCFDSQMKTPQKKICCCFCAAGLWLGGFDLYFKVGKHRCVQGQDARTSASRSHNPAFTFPFLHRTETNADRVQHADVKKGSEACSVPPAVTPSQSVWADRKWLKTWLCRWRLGLLERVISDKASLSACSHHQSQRRRECLHKPCPASSHSFLPIPATSPW